MLSRLMAKSVHKAIPDTSRSSYLESIKMPARV